MLECQKDKFSLPENVSYLNCAYFSPLLKQVEKIGYKAISQKKLPYQIKIDHFFEPVAELKQLFARLIDVDNYEQIALIPGVSYGISNVAKNIQLSAGENIVVVEEQFPSNVYPWLKKAHDTGAQIKTIQPTNMPSKRGKTWNDNMLDAIDSKTKVVALPHVHWADGTLFDLKAIRNQCDKYGSYLIIDGSQSVGALPFSVQDIRPDALICAGYKWLMGPYSLGLAYYNEKFDHGDPIEECWINKLESEDFQNLANYQEVYKPHAARYNVSESSNFILVPMLAAAIKQILAWTPKAIQEYCQMISSDAIHELIEHGCQIEEKTYRSNHLFGIRLSTDFDLESIKNSMAENNVYVSFRGNAIRVAPHVYNRQIDFAKLVQCIKQ